ncbi:hypothetical protein BDV96DRAFT_673835 [Lophiotrema nucula]|uniref:Uncharacterized protein n=1 Tax=Lophiotrema nucula TaxID=690887 RepID=A0A6A5YIK1_9PLEO|nr:hypothetical protein BDV96DRAFT_673835 [Lophiotrema nucula]
MAQSSSDISRTSSISTSSKASIQLSPARTMSPSEVFRGFRKNVLKMKINLPGRSKRGSVPDYANTQFPYTIERSLGTVVLTSKNSDVVFTLSQSGIRAWMIVWSRSSLTVKARHWMDYRNTCIGLLVALLAISFYMAYLFTHKSERFVMPNKITSLMILIYFTAALLVIAPILAMVVIKTLNEAYNLQILEGILDHCEQHQGVGSELWQAGCDAVAEFVAEQEVARVVNL